MGRRTPIIFYHMIMPNQSHVEPGGHARELPKSMDLSKLILTKEYMHIYMYTYIRVCIYMHIETDVHIQVCEHMLEISPHREMAEMQMSTNMCHHMRTNAVGMDPCIHVSKLALHDLHKGKTL
jgi:hypothetical protein